jgi:hypothetical protein
MRDCRERRRYCDDKGKSAENRDLAVVGTPSAHPVEQGARAWREGHFCGS